MKNIIFYFLSFPLFAPQVGNILRMQKGKMMVVGSCHIIAPAAIKITNSHPFSIICFFFFSCSHVKELCFDTDIILNERVSFPSCIFSAHM